MIVRVSKRPLQYEPMKCYEERKTTLSYCGYASYPEYLASDDWKAIRKKKLTTDPKCLLCDRTANQVHHLDYRDGTLLGLWMGRVVSLCDECHCSIEFDDEGNKLQLHEANGVLFHRACAQVGNWKKRRRWFELVKSLEKKRNKLHGQCRATSMRRAWKEAKAASEVLHPQAFKPIWQPRFRDLVAKQPGPKPGSKRKGK